MAIIGHTLREWGVSLSHDNMCICFPAQWGDLPKKVVATRFDPSQLLDAFSTASTSGSSVRKKRLQFTLGNLLRRGIAFARAVTWFDDRFWPEGRSESDFVQFFGMRDDIRNGLQASHLCHRANCIVPAHFFIESMAENLDRVRCVGYAQTLRKEGRPIPPRCSIHQPPCLLQVSLDQIQYVQPF